MERPRLATVLLLCVTSVSASTCGVGGSGGGYGGTSEAQQAYDACTSEFNARNGSLQRHWAFVSGIGSTGTGCAWSHKHGSVAAAKQSALAKCREGYPSCFVYSTSDGNEDWVQRISDNGGTDGSGNGQALSDALNLGVAAITLGAAVSGAGGGGYYGTTSYDTRQSYSIPADQFQGCASGYEAHYWGASNPPIYTCVPY